MAKHMGIDERKRIELLLGLRWTATEIAREMGRRESTISREILARRISSNKGYGCSNRLCAKFDECRRTRIWSAAQNTKLHKHLGGSSTSRAATCPRPASASPRAGRQ